MTKHLWKKLRLNDPDFDDYQFHSVLKCEKCNLKSCEEDFITIFMLGNFLTEFGTCNNIIIKGIIE